MCTSESVNAPKVNVFVEYSLQGSMQLFFFYPAFYPVIFIVDRKSEVGVDDGVDDPEKFF